MLIVEGILTVIAVLVLIIIMVNTALALKGPKFFIEQYMTNPELDGSTLVSRAGFWCSRSEAIEMAIKIYQETQPFTEVIVLNHDMKVIHTFTNAIVIA